ncbi:MAG: DUF2269 family protein [Marivibrio sp.]|uniref:DUF2269 family protein n=1 Tax=Marivibrio sp. TaxID=2039719 RepID=UPI0032EBBBED
MRQFIKILHTIASCGLIGGLAAYMILLIAMPQGTPQAYADLRGVIADISNWLLLPSLGIALVSGLLSMAVHKPYMDKRWVWVKAALGILMFKSVLTVVGAKADYAAAMADRILAGEASRAALDQALAYEWEALWTIMALSVANVVLGAGDRASKAARRTSRPPAIAARAPPTGRRTPERALSSSQRSVGVRRAACGGPADWDAPPEPARCAPPALYAQPPLAGAEEGAYLAPGARRGARFARATKRTGR